jgi:hypothetical protein
MIAVEDENGETLHVRIAKTRTGFKLTTRGASHLDVFHLHRLDHRQRLSGLDLVTLGNIKADEQARHRCEDENGETLHVRIAKTRTGFKLTTRGASHLVRVLPASRRSRR